MGVKEGVEINVASGKGYLGGILGIAKLLGGAFKVATNWTAAADKDGALAQRISNYNTLKGGQTIGSQLDTMLKGNAAPPPGSDTPGAGGPGGTK